MQDSHEVSYLLRPLDGNGLNRSGAIELPLQTAAKIDPNDQALDFMRDGMRQGDRRKELYEAREECYKVVTQTLGELDSKLSQAAASGDGETTCFALACDVC
jgi:nuclear pore complex protein Nup155